MAFRVEGDGYEPYETSFLWNGTSNRGQSGPADDLAVLCDKVRELRSCWRQPIHAVGVAMPAKLDGIGKVVAWPGRPTWIGFDLWVALRNLFPGTEMRYADDGDLAAIAEARQVDCRDIVYFGVGTGVGGGIVSGGRSFPGKSRGSSEIGHMVVDCDGIRCDCGRRGCLQAMASGPATLRRAGRLRGDNVTFAELRGAILTGERWAVSAVQGSCAALAAAIVSLEEILHPSLIVLGGGFVTQLPSFVETVAAEVAQLARPGSPPPPVQPAAFGGLSSLRGAVLVARGLAG